MAQPIIEPIIHSTCPLCGRPESDHADGCTRGLWGGVVLPAANPDPVVSILPLTIDISELQAPAGHPPRRFHLSEELTFTDYGQPIRGPLTISECFDPQCRICNGG